MGLPFFAGIMKAILTHAVYPKSAIASEIAESQTILALRRLSSYTHCVMLHFAYGTNVNLNHLNECLDTHGCSRSASRFGNNHGRFEKDQMSAPSRVLFRFLATACKNGTSGSCQLRRDSSPLVLCDFDLTLTAIRRTSIVPVAVGDFSCCIVALRSRRIQFRPTMPACRL